MLDKVTFSPVIGTSSQSSVSIEKSMDYIISLQEFKEIIREKKIDEKSTINIVTSSNDKVHCMIVNMQNNYLLITSFNEITESKTKILYNLIKEFSQKVESPTEISEAIIEEPTTIIAEKPIKKEPVEPLKPLKPIVAQKTQAELKVREKQEPKVKFKEEESMFSFVNTMRDKLKKQVEEEKLLKEQEKEREKVLIEQQETLEVSPPIVQEEITEELIIESDQTTQIETAEMVQPEIDESMPEEIGKVEEEKEPLIIEEKIEVIEELDKPEEEEEKKPKSRFIQRLQEESRRYKIKQIALEVAEKGKEVTEEKLDLSEDELKELVKFLAQTESSETK